MVDHRSAKLSLFTIHYSLFTILLSGIWFKKQLIWVKKQAIAFSLQIGLCDHRSQSMFLHLNHQKLVVCNFSRAFVLECYKLVKTFPPDEKFILSAQIRRAALSVHLNISEGASRKSPSERKRFYEIARGSLIEIDAALDISTDLKYCGKKDIEQLGFLMTECFKILSGLIKSCIP